LCQEEFAAYACHLGHAFAAGATRGRVLLKVASLGVGDLAGSELAGSG
jgi:hypothetical protein